MPSTCITKISALNDAVMKRVARPLNGDAHTAWFQTLAGHRPQARSVHLRHFPHVGQRHPHCPSNGRGSSDPARRTLQLREESLTIIRNRERGGLGTLLEVRQGEQLVHAAAQVIPGVEQLVEQTENQLSLLLGGSPAAMARGLSLIDQEPPPAVPAGLPSALLDRRPDILAAEQNLVAANAFIGVAKAAYFPRLSLTGFLGFRSDALSNLFSSPARIWQFVPQVTQPIFNAGRLRSNVRLATAQQELALIEYQRVIQTAFREVSDSLIQYRKVREIRAQQELLVATLQERSRLSYVRYQGGIDTLLNALDADRDLFDAELRLAQTRRNELIALVQLYRALGGGWQ